MLSSYSHLTLRLTAVKIFAVKWPKFTPTIWDVGDPLGVSPPHQGDFLSGTDVYHRVKFHADRCYRRRDICNGTEKKTATNISFHTNVWRAIKDCARGGS